MTQSNIREVAAKKQKPNYTWILIAMIVVSTCVWLLKEA